MNDNFDERLIGAAHRGLEHRLGDVPSERSVAVVKAYASMHARRIQIRRTLRNAFSVAASVAACFVFFYVILQDSGFHDVDPVLARDYDSYLALTALTTVIPELDDGGVAENALFLTDLDAEADFDAFSESLLRIQDSACLPLGSLAWN